jgi:hypothetical protein
MWRIYSNPDPQGVTHEVSKLGIEHYHAQEVSNLEMEHYYPLEVSKLGMELYMHWKRAN